MTKSHIIISHDFDYKKLIRALTTDDDIGALLRLHFEMERCMDFMISERFISPKHLNNKYFGQKLGTLKAVGFDHGRLRAFEYVNSVRNKMAHARKAHKAKEQIEAQEADELVSIVSSFMANPIDEFEIRARNVKRIDGKQIAELEPKDRFVAAGIIAAVDASVLPKFFDQGFLSKPSK